MAYGDVNMYYKETAEFVFDMLEHKYKTHFDEITTIGSDKFEVWIPLKYKEYLRTITNDYPITYRNIEIKFMDIGRIHFVLKEKDNEIKV